MAEKLGLKPEVIPTDWRSGADPNAIEARLKKDKAHDIKAVCVVHNETSTGTRTWVDQVRKAIDAARHPALLMVDTVSSLATMDYRHDEWGVDVAIAGSQKGLMLPPGLSFTAREPEGASPPARPPSCRAPTGRGTTCSTMNQMAPSRTRRRGGCLFGLAETIEILHEEGLDNVFARHERLAEATRRAVRAWGLEIWCRDPQSLFAGRHGGAAAGGPRRRRVPQARARQVRYVAWRGLRTLRQASTSASAISATSTTAG